MKHQITLFRISKNWLLLMCLFTAFVNSITAQTVTPWLTKGDQTQLLAQQATVSFAANSGTNPSTVTVNAGTTYQTIDGFGWCLTEGSAELITSLATTQQNALLNEMFNPTTGLSSSVVRIGIGASDLSSSDYSYNETAGDVNMTNFSLTGPDLTYVVPILQKILAINPNIKILATPWTAPRWMKSTNSWVGGSLQTTYYAAYAKYFVKYFQAMQALGINIWAITPQNEPENGGNDPSMTMTSTEQKNFINSQLGPQMAAAGFGGIKIIAYDHNCDDTAFPIDVLNNSTYVDGAAFHLYAPPISALTTVHNATGKNVYFTEQFTSSNGNFSGDFGWHLQNVVLGSVNNWAKTAIEWNVASNPALGPKTPGGCSECLGAFTISSSTSYTRNVSYYIIGQISKFVKTGAVRLSTTSSDSTISAASFNNTDGSTAVVIYNSGTAASSTKIVFGSQAFTYAIPAASAVTFRWLNGPPVAVTGVSVSPTSATVAVNSTTQLTATVAPANATNQNVTWTSSNAAVASVSSSGLVSGVAAGTATITVTTTDGNKTATSAITVNVIAVTGVTLTPTTASIYIGATQQLTPTVAPANASNKNVSYSSSNNAIATVNASGLVTGVAAGTVAITVTTADGSKTAISTITVKDQEPYTGTNISLPGIVQAENFDKGGQNLAYNDADTSNNGGQYRTSEGVDITAITPSGYAVGWTAAGEWLEYTVNVTAGTYTIDATVSTPNSGRQLVVKLDGATLTTFTLPNTTSFDTFQTVSVPNITFAGGNNKILRLEILGGDFNVDKIEVRSVVNVPVTGVTVSPTTASLITGNTQQLTKTISPANATNQNVTWTSSNTAVATVNSSGLVTAVAQGTAVITVTTADGAKTATSTFTINNQLPYTGTNISLPGIVQAENFDIGGQNNAYSDSDTSNNGGQYRTSEGVDIAVISGTSGYTVGWTVAGEWLEYTVNVTAGTYTIDATFATINSGKQMVVKLDGTTLATINVPNTGSWDTFQTVSVPNIAFAGGNNKILRFEILGGDFNIDKIEVKSVAAIPVTAVAVSPTTVSLVTGNTSQLTKTITPSNATNQNVTWTSSNTAAATVSASGLVTAVAAGTATITVTTADGAKTATCAVTVSNPSGGFPGYYNIISQNSGKGLDVADNSTSSGGRIQQYDITSGGGANQRWKFEDAGSGNYYIKVKSTQMCLATETNSTADGVKVVQKTPGTTNDFKWTVTSIGGGYYKIINVNSGKALDVENVSTANGANIQVWTYSSGTNQAWSFVQVESTARPGHAPAMDEEPAAISGSVSIYPNPAKNLVNVRFNSDDHFNIEIYNLAGRLVGTHQFDTKTNNVETIDISSFSAGVYLFKIADTKGISYKKVIKD